MQAALTSYADALKQAKSIEDNGRQLVDQAGGSGHGSTEVLYRLHASRLKILLHAVCKSVEELDSAQQEALRLTEQHWFHAPDINAIASSGQKDLQDRVWDVFADVVEGLAECRQQQPFFHRSVYRHAQALMWAPVVNNPRSMVGSMSTIPATRSFAIRGLNNSTPAAVSAGVVMSKLFDKERSQLCAVWVTTSSDSSPFQVLNSAIRKYDSLRGKYIAAYLEAMNLCKCQSEIETFMRWVYSSNRDLPSWFQASARNCGRRPVGSHSTDPLPMLGKIHGKSPLSTHGLLISCKRQANSSLSKVLLENVSNRLISSESSAQDTEKKLEFLKHAYACFLRLNCSLEELQVIHAFKQSGQPVSEVEVLCQGFLHFASPMKTPSESDLGDWSDGSNRKERLFIEAVEECKRLFPSLSGAFLPKKSTSTTKGGTGQKRKESTVDVSTPASPSTHGTKKISFEAVVPKGLTTGDTFVTSVNVGNADPIKVKLTVPTGNPSTLRFSLDVPKSSTRKITKKAKLSL